MKCKIPLLKELIHTMLCIVLPGKLIDYFLNVFIWGKMSDFSFSSEEKLPKS